MKSKNIKTKAKKISAPKAKTAAKKVAKATASKPAKVKKAEKVTKPDKVKGQNKNKKFFPKDAKMTTNKKSTKPSKATRKAPEQPVVTEPVAPTKVVAKRAPWSKKPVENIHSTPANAGYSMRSEFDKYIAKKYKRLKEDQIKVLWTTVINKMLAEPNLKLLEVVDNCLTKK